VSNQNVTYKTKIINKRLPLSLPFLASAYLPADAFYGGALSNLSLSLLLISAQFFVEPPSHAPPVQWRKVYIYIYSFLPTYITKLCNFVLRELAG